MNVRAACVCFAALCGFAPASPVTQTYPSAAYTSASAAAALSGWTAIANSRADTVELRDTSGTLRKTITATQMTALLPWMNLNTDSDGPCMLAFSDSGRLLYIGVCDSNNAPDGQAGDAVLRYDTYTDQLSIFLRIELGGFNLTPRPMAAHFKGRLYLATGGLITVYNARMNDTTATLITSTDFGSASVTAPLAIDRQTSTLYAASGATLARTSISTSSLSLVAVGTLPSSARSLAWSDHYGGSGQGGLYVAYSLPASPPADNPLIAFVTPNMARGLTTLAPSTYYRGVQPVTGLSATCEGAMLVASATTDSFVLSDSTDTRLTDTQWRADEFAQVVRLGKGLISPDGEPSGWVIDGDVLPGASRFHPATPDAAAWVVFLLLMNDRINIDPQALPQVRTILTRYAGLASDGIRPSRTADGIFRHWIDPFTGNAKSGWDPEYATLSTMKIVAAAARAAQYYPNDSGVRTAAHEIICGISNWDAYFDAAGRAYFKGLAAGGRDNTSVTTGWHESAIFAEQAGAYGSTTGPLNSNGWLTRSFWPTGTLVTGRGISSTSGGSIGPAFISLYPQLLVQRYRVDAAWQTNVVNLRLNNAAWTDDNGPKYNTVFSAGTTKGIWGGYNADSLTNHPGDLSTFTSLLSFCAGGPKAEADAAAAYHAYRNGARQTFKTGASILYRRSQVDQAYTPDSCGMPDVALGALGLAELISPGSVSQVLTGPYPSCACPADWNQDGGVDGADVDAFFTDWEAGNADINADGGTDGADVTTFFGYWEAGC
jgi:hypothetical protein